MYKPINADKARACFERDSVLTYHYNHIMSGGKWNHIMDQTHIGYKSWNDPKHNIMPKLLLFRNLVLLLHHLYL